MIAETAGIKNKTLFSSHNKKRCGRIKIRCSIARYPVQITNPIKRRGKTRRNLADKDNDFNGTIRFKAVSFVDYTPDFVAECIGPILLHFAVTVGCILATRVKLSLLVEFVR